MLCPEVWNFNSPPFSVATKLCESEEDIFLTLKHQYINHDVLLTLPNTIQTPKEIINALMEDSQFYKISKIPVCEFVKREFIDLFVKKGQLTAVSLNEFSDENSFVITPGGKFILSLTQSTYYGLGVDGICDKRSKISFKKYYVVLDLTADLSESQKKCEQVYKKLSVVSELNFDVVLAWEPEDCKICPSSIAYYFCKKNYSVKTCDVCHKPKVKYNVPVPVYDEESDVDEFIEWLGAFSLDCDLSDNKFSSLKTPEKNEVLGQVMQLRFTGLITLKRLRQVISEINKYINLNSPMGWISLTVQGFQNCIVQAKHKELVLVDGEQLSTIIFNLNQPSLIYLFHDKNNKN